MKQITWTAQSGKEIALTLHTERTINADGDRVTVDAYNLTLEVTGVTGLYSFRLTTHPEHGDILDAGHVKIKVPADKIEAVAALMDEYETEINRRIDAQMAVDAEYEEGRERMRQIMGY